METSLKHNLMRGTGLSFALACLVFVLTWNPLSFGLLLVGAAAGLAFDRIQKRFSRQRPPEAAGEIDPRTRSDTTLASEPAPVLIRWLTHPNLLARTVFLLGLAAILVLAAWTAGYFLLPEGALRSGAEGQMQRSGLDEQSRTAAEEWVKIFTANLLPAAFIVGSSLFLRVSGVPLGMVVVVYNLVLYGLFVGTNSFFIPYSERLAPSLAIFSRSGPYEMIALCLIASASAAWSRWKSRSLLGTAAQRVTPAQRITAAELLMLGAGIVLLASANWIEASMVMGS